MRGEMRRADYRSDDSDDSGPTSLRNPSPAGLATGGTAAKDATNHRHRLAA